MNLPPQQQQQYRNKHQQSSFHQGSSGAPYSGRSAQMNSDIAGYVHQASPPMYYQMPSPPQMLSRRSESDHQKQAPLLAAKPPLQPQQQQQMHSGRQLNDSEMPSQIYDVPQGGASDADRAVNTVYSGMKLLENNYIDLANFYKEQLNVEREVTAKLMRKDSSAPQQSLDRQLALKKQETTIKENAIIRGLIQVKGDLEWQMQELRSKVSQQQLTVDPNERLQSNQSSEQLQPVRQQPLYSPATHEFLQMTLQELLDELDKVQVSSLHVLSTKQYEMFDLATKNQIHSTLRNDYLGHWYDAKSVVSQNFADLKTALVMRKQMADVQFKLQESGGAIPDGMFLQKMQSFQAQLPIGLHQSRDAQYQLNTMMAEFKRYRQVSEQQAKKLKTIMIALKIKEQLFKDERQKSRRLLNELALSIDNQMSIEHGRFFNQRSQSPAADKTAHRAMGPFDKRLITNQPSSVQRLTPQNRSNSRGKNLSREGQDRHQSSQGQLRKGAQTPTGGFYTDHNVASGSKRATSNNTPTRDQQKANELPLSVIQTKLEKFVSAHEAASIASRQRDRYEKELLKNLDLHLREQLTYIGQGLKKWDENEVHEEDANALEELRELVNRERSTFVLQSELASPSYAGQLYNNQNLQAESEYSSKFGSQEPPGVQKYRAQAFDNQSEDENIDLENNQNQSMTQVNKVRSQKVQELQESNDQLFSELRKANEKYLDVRVENNKLKDQIQTLKLTVDQLKARESATGRQRALSSSGGGTYTAARKKAEPTQMSSPQADAELRKSHDILKTETQQVCNMVKTFMAAMRALQKAVSRKEPDMTEQKRAFDTAKRELEESVGQTLGKLRSQVPENQQDMTKVSAAQAPKTKSVSMMRGQQSAAVLPQSRDTSTQRMGHSATMRPQSLSASGYNNLASKRSSAASRNQRAEDELNLNLLHKQVRSLQMEKDKMRELIEELKQTNQLYTGERDLLEEKLKTKTAQLHKFASQCQISAQKVFMLEQVLADYKYTVIDLSSNAQVQQVLTDAGADSILQVRTNLQSKEDELKAKLDEEVSRIFVNLKIDPQFVALRDELTGQVRLKQKLLDQQFEQLTFRVAEKEEDLQRLKLLFVEKLRELETSFVEISHEVVETDKVTQDITAKRKQELQSLLEQKPMNGQDKNNLDRSMEAILSNYDDDEKSNQIEELVQANHDLMEQVERLKRDLVEKEAQAQAQIATDAALAPGGSKARAANDSLHAEMVIELNEQIDEVRQEGEKLKMQLKVAHSSEAMLKKEIQGMKYDNKRMTMDLKDSKERFEKAKGEYQHQFAQLKSTTVAMKSQLQKEYEARTLHETKYLAASKQLKIARQESAEQQTEMLILMKRLEDLHTEQTYLKQLRATDSDTEEDSAEEEKQDEGSIVGGETQIADKISEPQDQVDENGQPVESEQQQPLPAKKRTKSQKKEEEEAKEMEDRVADDAIDATRHYFRLLQVTKQEFKAVQQQNIKLVQQDAQESNLNSKLQQLEQEKEDLEAKAAKSTRGTKLVISLQNCVRKMLQEKLEEQARQIEELGRRSQAAQAEAEQLRKQAAQIEQGHPEANGAQLSAVEQNIADVRQQLEEAEKQKEAGREEARLVKEQEQKLGEAANLSQGELRRIITEELEEKHKKQQQELIQTYKRAQRQTNERHQEKLLALETQLAEGKTSGGEGTKDSIAELRVSMQAEHEAMVSRLEEESDGKLQKAQRATRLMVCLQNRVREMIAAKLEEARAESGSLREDLQDVTKSHNLQIVQLRETLERDSQDQTAQIIKQHEEQMRQFELKLRQEALETSSQSEQEKMAALVSKFEAQRVDELEQLRISLETKSLDQERENARNAKATKIMNCMQNFVRNMLKDRLERREQELQLEIIQVKESADLACDRLRASEDDFERYRQEKSKELDEIRSYQDDSDKKSGQIDAAEAQLQSLKSVKEAMEREKDDLLIQNEHMDEEIHRIKAELLEVKGSLEVKEMRVEELEEQLGEMQQAMTDQHNRTSDLNLGSSGGVVVHQGDNLRSLETGSDGNMGDDSFRMGVEAGSAAAQNQENAERTVDQLMQENAGLRDQVEKLRQDLDANVASVGAGRTSWDGSRGSWGSDQMRSNNREVEEHLKHVRSIMTQFLTKLPVSNKENEDILTIVYSMLNFPREDIDSITEARTQLADKSGKKGGGMFGGFKSKKK